MIPMFQISSFILWAFLSSFLGRCAFNDPSNPRWCTGDTCVGDEGGRICYLPSSNLGITSKSCDGGFSNSPYYQSVLDTHLRQDFSIAYYANDDTNERLGGVNYIIPAGTTVKLCLSGEVVGEGGYQTRCSLANANNDITTSQPYCLVPLSQYFVSDSCYMVLSKNSSISPLFNSSLDTPSSNSESANVGNSPSQHSNSPNNITVIKITVPISVTVGGGASAGLGVFLCRRRRRRRNAKKKKNVPNTTNNDDASIEVMMV